MKNEVNNICKRMVLIFLSVIFAFSFVNAVGVATTYHDGNPLRLAPGESASVDLRIQNMLGDEDYMFRAELVEDGGGIARILDDPPEYFVPAKTEDVRINLEVSVPETDVIGGVREIKVKLTQIGAEDGGMVSVSSGFVTGFPVEVVSEEESVMYNPPSKEKVSAKNVFVTFILVILLVVILLAIKKKKKSY